MNSRTFSKLFRIVGLVIFLTTTALTLLFAEGYRFDLSTNNIVRTGLIAFEGGFSSGYKLFIDGKLIDNSLFSSQVSVTPGQHALEVRKLNYRSWRKEVLVPEQDVLKFRPLQLLPDLPENSLADFFKKKIETLSLTTLQLIGSGNYAALVTNEALHYTKQYSLGRRLSYSVIDTNLTAKGLLKTLPVDENTWVLLDKQGRVFLFDVINKKHIPFTIPDGVKIVDVSLTTDAFFLLSESGVVYRVTISDNAISVTELSLFINITQPAKSIILSEGQDGLFAFLIGLKGDKNVLIVANDAGSILFQEGGVTAAQLDSEGRVQYATAEKLVTFNVLEKKLLKEKKISDSQIEQFVRIGETYHMLFVTKDHLLSYCDEDFENCVSLGKIGTPLLLPSLHGRFFMTVVENSLVVFDFGAVSDLPEFLQNLFS